MKKEYVLTDFQAKVLRATLKIPFGETRTYQWVADEIGSPGAVRAVGSALRKNPWPITVPCHRVVKSDGTLGKYFGKDDGQKKALLSLEQHVLQLVRGVEKKISEKTRKRFLK